MKSTFVMTGSRGWSFFAPVVVVSLVLGGCGSDSDDSPSPDPDPVPSERLELVPIAEAEFSSSDDAAVIAGTLLFDLASASSFDEEQLRADDGPLYGATCNEAGGFLAQPAEIVPVPTPFLNDKALTGSAGHRAEHCVSDGELIDGVFGAASEPPPLVNDQEELAFMAFGAGGPLTIDGADETALELLGWYHQKRAPSSLKRYSHVVVATRFANPYGDGTLNVQMQLGQWPSIYDSYDQSLPLSDYLARDVTFVGGSGNMETTLDGRWGIRWTYECGGGVVDLETLAPLQQTSSNEPYIAGKLRLTATEKTADAELVGPDELVVTLDGVSRSYSKSDVNDLVEACVTQ
ncbi:hypothetical protein [Marinobacter xestospongiae]|uniref:hypothetical protein n=1 Tax=Marinobacter xestospongiae TaxID=994319 RepID=UPI002005996B|nr:hypothetical protein [Marinobacter xestospongiae]MCK7565037.1 hypothetical protein [Marinobacter xestospongiae]